MTPLLYISVQQHRFQYSYTRGVADSFSGGSPDLKKKLKKLKKTEKTEKFVFLPNIVSKKRCFSVFVSLKIQILSWKTWKIWKKTEKSEKNLKNILKNFSWFTWEKSRQPLGFLHDLLSGEIKLRANYTFLRDETSLIEFVCEQRHRHLRMSNS